MIKMNLNIQLFASKKGVGSTKNGRDSAGRRLGSKVSDGQRCTAGSNTGMGKDHTLYAKIDGVVRYERKGKDKKQVSVYEN